MSGDDGNDTLAGGSGNDDLHGDLGADTLDGDAGNERLFGDPGRDVFYFRNGDNGEDVIEDYQLGPAGGAGESIRFCYNVREYHRLSGRDVGSNHVITISVGSRVNYQGSITLKELPTGPPTSRTSTSPELHLPIAGAADICPVIPEKAEDPRAAGPWRVFTKVFRRGQSPDRGM